MFIFYFLVILIGLYLLLPIIQLIAKYGSKKLHFAILYGSFIVTWIMGFTYYFPSFNGSITSLTTQWLPFFVYFWWGFMIKKNYFRSTEKFLYLFVTWISLTLAMGLLGFLLNAANIRLGFKSGIFYWHDYLSPNISLAATGFFAWIIGNKALTKIKIKPIIAKNISILAVLSYGVYLIHMFVIDFLDIKYRFAIEFVENSLISFITIRPILTIILSFIIAWLISKIPYFRKLIGIV